MVRGRGQHWFRTGWLAAAACVGASAGAAQPDAPHPDEELDAITAPLLSAVADEEARNGPMSPNLVDPLTSLGLAYQESGEHVLAIAMLDRALYLKRVNEGLFRLDQAAVVERIIASEKAIGRVGTVEQLEKRLVDLARRNSGDPRSATIFREAAERELDHYEAYLSGDVPEDIPAIFIDDWAIEAVMSLWQSRRHYNEAIFALLGDAREHQAELKDLEERLARTYYLEAGNRGRYYQGPGDPLYGMGLVSYERRVGYTRAARPTAADYAQTLIERADWSLLFSRNNTAVKRYAEAYDLLVKNGASASSIEQLFPADIPVFLPTFESPLAGAARAGSTGYIDVDFEIGKYGQPRKVAVVAVAGNDAAAASKYVASAINRARFRPSPVTAGETQYRLRYSLADGSLAPRP